MCSFPLFKFLLVPCNLVFPVTDEIEEFNCTHPPNIIPTAPAGFRDIINICYPTPFILERISCTCLISFSLINLFGIFFISLSE